MSDSENAAPAGDSDQSTYANSSLESVTEAYERAQSQDRPEPTQAGTDALALLDAGTASERPETETAGEEPANEAAPEEQAEDEGIELDKIHGNSKVRLRNGREWTGRELKQRLDDLEQLDAQRRDFDTQRQEFDARQQEYQRQAQHVLQQAQHFEQIAPQALAVLQAQIPEILPKPDLALRDEDYLGYQYALDDHQRSVDAYNQVLGQIEQIRQEQVRLANERQQQSETARQAYLREQQVRLYEMMPELRDDAKKKAFVDDYMNYGVKTYGFSEEELGNAYDPRLMMMARDAMSYRKLMESKPKPAPAKPQPQAAPVAQPGRRVSAQEAKQAQRDEVLQRAKSKPGGLSLAEAASLYSRYEE